MNELVAVLIMFGGAGLVVLLLLGLSQWLGPKKRNPVKDEIFECGNIPISTTRDRFSIKFYTIAILFVLFDIEIIFLFPWSVVFRSLGAVGLISMTLFIAVLALGLAYAWKKGALQWD
ncbi:NADH-quinone oxidoreductase subunit A [candidate division KSB1 bacterium]|nr:NADH-quinone oxidoreductase subunit A [candidate division KSB1 bacterium]NIS24843.1 NADH-quinone oxidoreductase subunit A [candidate division KSB1 bacterium]NIT71763.1 NADH-quinone oxidoreductase subunit A [candidate division KSB1 bacterium]NIU25483.1 NADH-quinone oxidoreductase subunit A [candidate division KSB1 bacterium]NIU89416.1 NAD(P)H-quinone oxidoreductase subunit 3 [candidate division KSB1 bacterium]